mmetsp:Transcript_82731/g.183789  ORF Transcript_82731/g.183789 Transcript_82731/m.183789 type:complete len:296 (+) Transcript_82731:58-945(+)
MRRTPSSASQAATCSSSPATRRRRLTFARCCCAAWAASAMVWSACVNASEPMPLAPSRRRVRISAARGSLRSERKREQRVSAPISVAAAAAAAAVVEFLVMASRLKALCLAPTLPPLLLITSAPSRPLSEGKRVFGCRPSFPVVRRPVQRTTAPRNSPASLSPELRSRPPPAHLRPRRHPAQVPPMGKPSAAALALATRAIARAAAEAAAGVAAAPIWRTRSRRGLRPCWHRVIARPCFSLAPKKSRSLPGTWPARKHRKRLRRRCRAGAPWYSRSPRTLRIPPRTPERTPPRSL